MLRWRRCDQLSQFSITSGWPPRGSRMLSTLLGIAVRLPVSIVGCDDCDLAVLMFVVHTPKMAALRARHPSNDFGNERKLAARVIGTMKRRETTVNDYWTVKAIFAFALTCLVGAEIALYSGLPLVPPNWP